MKEYIFGILKDHKGDPSSSRWLAVLAFFALCGLIWIGVGSDPKQHKLVVDLAQALTWLIIGCVVAGQGSSAVSAMIPTTTATPPTTIATGPPLPPSPPQPLITPADPPKVPGAP